MRFFDKEFTQNKRYFILQSCLAGCAVAVALAFFDVVRQPVIIASFGASTFIAFTMPHQEISSPRHLIGGYFIGVVIGCLIHYAASVPVEEYILQKSCVILASAVAMALSMFLMAVTDTEHPPAASIALGFVINVWTFSTAVYVMVGITVISVLKLFLRPAMKDIL